MNKASIQAKVAMAVALLIAVAFALTGCATPQPGDKMTLDDVKQIACPLVLGVVVGLQAEDSIGQDLRDGLTVAEPVVRAGCEAEAGLEALRSMSVAAIPPIITLIKASDLTPEQKQAASVSLITAQVLIANFHTYPVR